MGSMRLRSCSRQQGAQFKTGYRCFLSGENAAAGDAYLTVTTPLSVVY